MVRGFQTPAVGAAGDASQQQQPQQQQQQQLPSTSGSACGSSADKRPDGLHQGSGARVSANPAEAEAHAVTAPAGGEASWLATHRWLHGELSD